jgi:hypothetical protein
MRTIIAILVIGLIAVDAFTSLKPIFTMFEDLELSANDKDWLFGYLSYDL